MNLVNVSQSVSILKFKEEKCETVEDTVVFESGLRIVLVDSQGEENFALVHTLPADYESLIIGLLFTSRMIASPDEVEQIKVRNQLATVRLADESGFREKLSALRPAARIVTGLCGPEEGALGTWRACDVPPISTTVTVTPSIIRQGIQRLNESMELYRQTGGTHGAALIDWAGKIMELAEDVGRHNAVDRVIGKALRSDLVLSDLMLMCSGRLTGDLILKAAVAQIPVVASISAGISSGIELAEAAGVTMIGFVRGMRMNVYTHPGRLILATG
jgi:FdhD protein